MYTQQGLMYSAFGHMSQAMSKRNLAGSTQDSISLNTGDCLRCYQVFWSQNALKQKSVIFILNNTARSSLPRSQWCLQASPPLDFR